MFIVTIPVYMYMYIYMCIYMCVRVCVCACARVYAYVYAYTYAYTYIYIYNIYILYIYRKQYFSYRHGVKSIRDLTEEHLPLLRNIQKTSLVSIALGFVCLQHLLLRLKWSDLNYSISSSELGLIECIILGFSSLEF